MNMHRIVACVVLALVSSVCLSAEKEDTLDQLIARAEKAHPDDQPALYVQVAEHQLKAANDFYTEGKNVDGESAIGDVSTYAGKAHDVVLKHPKKMKQTEISLRKIAERLRDMKRTLSFEDQAPVQKAADQLESLRTDLQKHMFGGK